MPAHSALPQGLYHGARLAAPAHPPRGGALALAAAFTLMCLASATLAARPELERRAPALGRVYAAIGLPASPAAVSLRNISSSLAEAGGQSVLSVEGEIANSTRAEVRLSKLRISLEGADGREIYHWTAPSPKPSLAPGESISFRAKLESPPAEARRIAVRFAGPGDDSWLAAK